MTRGRRYGTVRLRSGQALEWSVPKAQERESQCRPFDAHRREKMKSKMLALGFACLWMVAVAQTNEKQSKEKQNQPAAAVKSPRDVATGQASGKAMSDQKVVHRDLAARD